MVLSVLKPCLMKLGLVGVLVMVLSGLGRQASAGTVADPNEFTDHEALANDEAFDSVGRFIGATETSAYSASGVYLGDGWVLTAAHVVDEATSLSFEIGGATYEAEAWAYHADWNPADIVSGADIALVKLAGDAAPPITGATLYTGSEEDLLGAVGVSVGYGVTGTGATGYDPASSTEKRAGTNTIDLVHSDDVLISDLDSGWWPHNSTGSSSVTDLEYLIAPGDSGGGLFVYDQVLDDWVLAGVNSFGYGVDGVADSDFGDLSGQISVAYYEDWILDILAAGLTDAASLNGVVATVIPEPATAALLGLCLLIVSRGRLGRPHRRALESERARSVCRRS